MQATQKSSIWKRIGDMLQECSKALDYGIFDIVEEQAKHLKRLEGDVVALQAEVELLRKKTPHNCSTWDGA